MIDFNYYVETVNNALEKSLPSDGEKLTEAMRYSIFVGGKRIRPILTVLACEFCGGLLEEALPFACALEIIHTYSLIFDDMPCMDNDCLRRGKPTNHVVFGEDIALMAGMGLYSRAFEIVIDSNLLSDHQKIRGTKLLLDASGSNGIVLGQVLDMQNNSKQNVTEDLVRRVHSLKTSAMLEASVLLGALAANSDKEKSDVLWQYAKDIGLAFQIRDDILDVIGSKENMGKTLGKDKAEEKTTFVDILGLENAQKQVEILSQNAKNIISKYEGCENLCELADILCNRVK